MQALSLTAFFALSSNLQAQSVSQEPIDGLSGRIGSVVANQPTYEGSPNRRTLVAPDLTLNYRMRDWGSVEFSQRGLFWHALQAGHFRFSVVAQFDPGRKDKDSSTLNPIPGDKRLAGMGSTRATTQAGLGVGYGPVTLLARHVLGESGPHRAEVELSTGMPWALTDRFVLNFALAATWANQASMQTNFGVTAAQASSSSFSVYTPKSGCRKVEANVGGEYALASSWKLQGQVGITQLGTGATASPIVSRRNSTFAALGVAYEF